MNDSHDPGATSGPGSPAERKRAGSTRRAGGRGRGASHEELVEVSLRSARENPRDTARWLACEVLLGGAAELGDDELADRLLGLQDRLSDLTRARYGIPVAPATPEIPVIPAIAAGKAPGGAMPGLPERVERLEAWTEVIMGAIARLSDMAEPLLIELEGARRLYGRADDPYREDYADYQQDAQAQHADSGA